jgi:hypothetical protein
VISWISQLSGKKTLSVFVVPDWWHSGVAVGNGVFSGVGVAVGEVTPQAAAAKVISNTRLAGMIRLGTDIIYSSNT